MLKKITAFVITAIITLSAICIPVSYATETTSTTTPADIVSELAKYESPYYGYVPMDFDFTNDGVIDTFDLVILKRRLIAGDPEITIATAVKLQSWLLGKPWATLNIKQYPTTYFTPSEYRNDSFKNLTSNDFRFIKAEETIIVDSNDTNGAYSRGVALYFLGIDETLMESVFIDTFCNSVDEFDEFVTSTEGPGFYIGIKDGAYALAVKTATTITANPNVGISEETSNIATVEIKSEEKVPEIGSAYIMFDLTQVDSNRNFEFAEKVSYYLNSTSYEITTKRYDSSIILISAKTELAEMEILVEEQPSAELAQTVLFENEKLCLFLSAEGFGVCLK